MKKFFLSVVGILSFIAIAVGTAVAAPQATISWLPNTEPNIAEYRLYQSTTSGVYGTAPLYITPVTSNSITVNLTVQRCTVRYYWTLTAYNDLGQESTKSIEVYKDIVGSQYWIGMCKK
jgi:hypothetical protein